MTYFIPDKSCKLFFVAALACFMPFQAICEQSQSFAPDSSDVILRIPDTEQISRYSEDPEFRYDEASAPGESFIELLWIELIRFLNRLFGEGTGNTVIKIVMFLCLAAAILLVLNRLLGGEIGSVFTGKSASRTVGFENADSGQSAIDLDHQIKQMADQKKYRQAARLIYRKVLGELSEKGLITWSAEKTNYDYLLETSSHPVSDPFRQMTRIHDYVEYGDFGIEKEGYEKVQDIYQNIRNALRNERGQTV